MLYSYNIEDLHIVAKGLLEYETLTGEEIDYEFPDTTTISSVM